jgi:D-cysteine desulfhydrase family pyridoxal phosphate-dependent enzyme
MTKYSPQNIKAILNQCPKLDLIFKPTPIQKLENLSLFLDGPEIYLKRDDLTGVAFGGNKSRKLEYIIQEVLQQKADVIITWAGLQSNWCLQTAAVARKFGITPLLILFSSQGIQVEFDGNLLLDFILDADIKIREAEKGKVIRWNIIKDIIDEVRSEVREWGHVPYVAPVGGSLVCGSMQKPLGAYAYLEAFLEVYEQTQTLGFLPDYIIHASGSGGTQAGLITGALAVSPKTSVLGINVSDDTDYFRKEVELICKDTRDSLGLEIDVTSDDIRILDEYTHAGYGALTPEITEAIRLTALKEGIFLDPVYTGKAMAGLFDLIKKDFFKKTEKVVFIHTGGTAALFPYRKTIIEHIKKKAR